jgi:DNA-binding MarR family transcriptional regulator
MTVARPIALARNRPESAPANGPDAVDFGPLADWIGFHLRMAQIASFQSFALQSRDIDLSPGRFAALMVIGRNPGLSQTALSRSIGSDKSTLTPALEDLVRRGLVRRTRTRSDRRTYKLTLTAAGEKMLRDLTQCAQRHEDHLDALVGPRERAQFLRTLRKIATNLP